MARPKKEIDEKALVAMAERGWSIRGIAVAFGVDEKTIRTRYSALIEDSRQHGKEKLLDVLWQRAVTSKSDRVLCHLADRLLGKVATPVELGNKDKDGFKVILEDYRKKDE